MVSGGSRARSGPPKDPNSGRSDKLGVSFDKLPASGYAGEVPEFPLMPYTVSTMVVEGGEKFTAVDHATTETFRDREAELWSWAWSMPQAHAWVKEPWRWQAVAQWVRTSVICETTEASAADRSSLHRFADQIGMTPAGLRYNGWTISHDPSTASTKTEEEPASRSRRRLRVV